MIAAHKLLATIIQGNGYSLTRPRQLVFEALNEHDSLSMGELVKRIGDSCDRASVYRTIELFEQLNIVQRVPIGWKYKLELSGLFKGHHHHAVCLNCDRVIEFNETPAIEKALDQLVAELDFKITEHSLELQGYCSRCQQKTAL